MSVENTHFTRVCPRDIYSYTVRNMDRWIVASSNDHKETRSTTPRLDPAVSARPHLEHNIRNHPRVWRPVRCQARLGGMAAYPPGALAVSNKNKAGRAAPVRRVTICGHVAVKTMARLPCRCLPGTGRCKHPRGFDIQLHGSPDSPIQFEVRGAHGDQGVDPLPRLRRGCFSMCSNLNSAGRTRLA